VANIFVSSPRPWVATRQLIYNLGSSVFYACDTDPNTIPAGTSLGAYYDPLEIYTPASVSTTSSSSTTSFTVPATQTSPSSSTPSTTSSSPLLTPIDSHDVLSVGAEIGSIVGAGALVVAIWQLVKQIQKWRREEQA